jgi:hypothetical protein
MYKKRVIALFVAFAFLSLLAASTMPLRADQAAGQAGTAVSSPEQGPGFVEEEGYGSAPAKKSIVPIILIGVGVAALAAVLVLVVFKAKYDIAGSWSLHATYDDDDYVYDSIIVFTGDKKSGTTSDNWGGSGTYSVDGKNVTFTIHWPNDNTSTYTGSFDGKDKMNGRFHESVGFDGPWTAVRGATAASLPKLKETGSNKGPGR